MPQEDTLLWSWPKGQEVEANRTNTEIEKGKISQGSLGTNQVVLQEHYNTLKVRFFKRDDPLSMMFLCADMQSTIENYKYCFQYPYNAPYYNI